MSRKMIDYNINDKGLVDKIDGRGIAGVLPDIPESTKYTIGIITKNMYCAVKAKDYAIGDMISFTAYVNKDNNIIAASIASNTSPVVIIGTATFIATISIGPSSLYDERSVWLNLTCINAGTVDKQTPYRPDVYITVLNEKAS